MPIQPKTAPDPEGRGLGVRAGFHSLGATRGGGLGLAWALPKPFSTLPCPPPPSSPVGGGDLGGGEGLEKKLKGGGTMVKILVSTFHNKSFIISFNGSEHVDEIYQVLEHYAREAKYFLPISSVPDEFESKLRIVRRGCWDSYLGQLIDEMLQDIELDRRFAEGVRS